MAADVARIAVRLTLWLALAEMCMTLALSRVGLTALATDMRHSLYTTDGQARRLDAGGKLAKLGNAWIAMGGDALHAEAVLERLADLDARSIEEVTAAITEAAVDAPRTIADRWPGVPSKPDHRSVYMIAARGEVAAVRYDGELLHRGHDSLLVSYPHGFPNREQAHEKLGAALSTARTQWGLVRIVAKEFATVAECSESVSPNIEIVVGCRYYLSGESSALARMTDAEIERAVREVPPTNPAAFTEILERYVG